MTDEESKIETSTNANDLVSIHRRIAEAMGFRIEPDGPGHDGKQLWRLMDPRGNCVVDKYRTWRALIEEHCNFSDERSEHLQIWLEKKQAVLCICANWLKIYVEPFGATVCLQMLDGFCGSGYAKTIGMAIVLAVNEWLKASNEETHK